VFSTESGINSGKVMKVGGRMALLVATITSLGMIGTGRLIHLTRNIETDGHILRQGKGFTLCHTIMLFLVLTGTYLFKPLAIFFDMC
jgi:hypothetical protein